MAETRKVLEGDGVVLVEDPVQRTLRLSVRREVIAFLADLADRASAAKGPGAIGYNAGLDYPDGSLGRRIAEELSATDAGGDPNGVGESAAAIAAAVSDRGLVRRPKGSYKRGGTVVTYLSDGFEGRLWMGDRNVSYSDDAVVIVARNVDSTASGNGHSFTDSSYITRGGGVSFNSFDARVVFGGTVNFGHYAAFQSGPVKGGSGTMTDLFSFVSSPTINGGVLTNYYGNVVNPPTVGPGGLVVNSLALYAPTTFGKPYNPSTGEVWFFRNDSTAPSYSAGAISAAGGLVAGSDDTSYTPVKTLTALTAAGAEAGLRLQQLETQTWDMTNPASATYLRWGSAAGEQLRLLNSGGLQPGGDNVSALGGPGVRWTVVHAATSTISTSDKRHKVDVEDVPVEWLQAWGEVAWRRFKFADAVAEKAGAARWHVGLVAQDVRDVFARHGIDALQIGLLCYDAWPDQWETVPAVYRLSSVLGSDSKPFKVLETPAERRLVRAAGDLWGVRYEEALALDAAYLRWLARAA